jgi:hypothetical protein
MSCKAEVVVEQYQDAVYIPVQAVIRVGGEPTVYVLKEKAFEPRTVEIGLDNNRMVRIVGGLNEGEVVLLTPPLTPGTLEPTAEVAAEPNAAEGAAGSIEQRVRAKLEEANGTGAPGQIAEPQTGDRTGQDFAPAREGRDTQAGAGEQRIPPESSNLSPEEMQKMKERFENMSPEERSKEIEKMKERFQNVPAEQRQRRRQRQDGASPGEGRSSGQSVPQGEQQ